MLGLISILIGIFSIVGMMIAFIPCLGFLNWLSIPFAMIGLVINIVSYIYAGPSTSKTHIVAGIIMCAISICVGILRLIIGGGFF
jgi:hypothetical protein